MSTPTVSGPGRVARTLTTLVFVPLFALGSFDSVARSAPVPGAPNCSVFPATNVWNADISSLPVAANSAQLISSIGLSTGLHPDFGSNLSYGIPYNVVPDTTPKVSVHFQYASESDPGPYPI